MECRYVKQLSSDSGMAGLNLAPVINSAGGLRHVEAFHLSSLISSMALINYAFLPHRVLVRMSARKIRHVKCLEL